MKFAENLQLGEIKFLTGSIWSTRYNYEITQIMKWHEIAPNLEFSINLHEIYTRFA